MSGEREAIRQRKELFEKNLIDNGTCSPEKARELGIREARKFDRQVRAGQIDIHHGRKK